MPQQKAHATHIDVADELDFQYAADFLPPSDLYMDGGFSLTSLPNLLDNSQLDLNSFNFANLDSREMSHNWPVDTQCPFTDNLSDASLPSLITENNSASSNDGGNSSPQQQDRHCRNTEGCCTSLATGVLNSMHTGSSSCILSMGEHSGGVSHQPQLRPAADSILSMNQSALRTIRSMLQCHCYENPQVLLLVTVICSEVTTWYWHIIDIYSHRRGSTAGGSLHATTGSTECQRRDFFIGSHRLGKDVEIAVIRQVLLSMVQELRVVIGDIACHAGPTPRVNESRSATMLRTVRARMVAFLHTQLRALTSALDTPGSDLGTIPAPISHS